MSERKYRVACYCRVATRSQVDNVPLEAQSTRLHRYADDHDLEVVGEVQVYEKGITMNRPGWFNVLSIAAREKADAILVTDFDRVARDPWAVMKTIKELSSQNMAVLSTDYNLSSYTDIRDLGLRLV